MQLHLRALRKNIVVRLCGRICDDMKNMIFSIFNSFIILYRSKIINGITIHRRSSQVGNFKNITHVFKS